MGFFCVLRSVILQAYRWFQALSLDIALGAVVFSSAIAKYLNTTLTWPIQLSLFICVWLIYTFDHLMDSEEPISADNSLRHYLHHRFRKEIALVMIAVIMIGVITLFYLPPSIILWGTTTAAFIVIYFLVVRFTRFWAKEVFVALGYTAGIFLAPISLSADLVQLDVTLLMVEVFLLAIINLIIFSYFDFDFDKNVGFPSLAVRFGRHKMTRALVFLLSLSFLVVLGLIWKNNTSLLFWTFLLMNIGLILPMLSQAYFTRQGYYRVIGDGVFFVPLIYLIYA